MGVSEGALPGVGEECGPGVYVVCLGEFLYGQAGIGCHMRSIRLQVGMGRENRLTAIQTVTNRLPIAHELVVDGSNF